MITILKVKDGIVLEKRSYKSTKTGKDVNILVLSVKEDENQRQEILEVLVGDSSKFKRGDVFVGDLACKKFVYNGVSRDSWSIIK